MYGFELISVDVEYYLQNVCGLVSKAITDTKEQKLMEDELVYVLNYIMDRILAKTISMDELNDIVARELDILEMWEIDNLLITDCYYTLKHIEKEQISVKEWMFFQQCFIKKRKYSLEDKLQFVSKK